MTATIDDVLAAMTPLTWGQHLILRNKSAHPTTLYDYPRESRAVERATGIISAKWAAETYLPPTAPGVYPWRGWNTAGTRRVWEVLYSIGLGLAPADYPAFLARIQQRILTLPTGAEADAYVARLRSGGAFDDASWSYP